MRQATITITASVLTLAAAGLRAAGRARARSQRRRGCGCLCGPQLCAAATAPASAPGRCHPWRDHEAGHRRAGTPRGTDCYVRLGRRAVYTGTASKSGFRIARARIRTRR